MTTALSLDTLAGQIRDEHEQVGLALASALDHALHAGDLLIDAKAQLGHGEWLPWIAEHCGFAERTAQAYMRLAQNRAALEGQIRNGVADLSVRGAIALLTDPRGADHGAEPPTEAEARIEEGIRQLTNSQPDELVAFTRARLGDEDADTAIFEQTYPFRWRLTKVALSVPADISPDELKIMGGALAKWQRFMHEADPLMWWIGDWSNALRAWGDQYKIAPRRLDEALTLKKAGTFSTGEEVAGWVRDLPERDRVAVVPHLRLMAQVHGHYPGGIPAYIQHREDHKWRLRALYQEFLPPKATPTKAEGGRR